MSIWQTPDGKLVCADEAARIPGAVMVTIVPKENIQHIEIEQLPDTIFAVSDRTWMETGDCPPFGWSICEFVRKDLQTTTYVVEPANHTESEVIDYLRKSVRHWQDAYQKEKNRVIELVAETKRLNEIMEKYK